MKDLKKEIIDKIETLNLLKHPEGGYFNETYRSKDHLEQDLSSDFEGTRNLLTSIYFLLLHDEYSAWHRIKSDEMWYFHEGNPLNVHVITPEGKYTCHSLGLDLKRGQRPFCWVPKNSVFASENLSFSDGYSLVSCAVAPGFDFQDFELISKEDADFQTSIKDLKIPDLFVK